VFRTRPIAAIQRLPRKQAGAPINKRPTYHLRKIQPPRKRLNIVFAGFCTRRTTTPAIAERNAFSAKVDLLWLTFKTGRSRRLDLAARNASAQVFVGEHDFAR